MYKQPSLTSVHPNTVTVTSASYSMPDGTFHNQWETVLSKVDDFATFKKVEVHAENSTF